MSCVSFVEGEKRWFERELIHRKIENVIATGCGSETALIFRTSLQAAEERVTYDEMNNAANRIARFLVKETREQNLTSNVDSDWIVAICMEPTNELIIALLAALKTGGAYMVIDPSWPATRIEHIINESRPMALIYSAKNPDWTDETLQNTKCYSYKQLSKASAELPSANLKTDEILVAENDQNVAIVGYTSGSTGLPKGARLQHSICMNFLNWQFEALPYAPNERICVLKTILSFLDSMREVFGPLLTGRQLLIIPEAARIDTEKLIAFVDEYKIRRMIAVPSLLKSILTFLNMQKGTKLLQNLTLWMATSETLTPQLASEFYDYFDEKTHVLLNLFGCTELAADIVHYVVEGKAHTRQLVKVPIGRPMFNTAVYALDDQMQPVPRGQQGQMAFAGKSVSLGYVNGRDKDRFRPNPLSSDPIYNRFYFPGDYIRIDQDGVIDYDGRTDAQVKVNGHRIDLNEVDLHLRKIPGILHGVTLAYHSGKDDQVIISFILVEGGKRTELSEDAVKSSLKEKLSDYMMPDHIVSVENMPVTTAGKTDRQSLLKLYENGTTYSYHDFSGVPAAKKGNAVSLDEFISAKNMEEIILHMSDRVTGDRCPSVAEKMDFHIEKLGPADKDQTILVVCKSFADKSDLDLCLTNTDASLDDYIQTMEAVWSELEANDLCFVVKDNNGRVLGGSLNYNVHNEPVFPIIGSFGIAMGMVDLLEHPIKTSLPEETQVLLKFMMGTHWDLSPSETVAVMAYMEEEVQNMAIEKGFHGILTTNISQLTQQLTQQLLAYEGYEVVNQILANQYVFEGKKPYAKAPDDYLVTVEYKEI